MKIFFIALFICLSPMGIAHGQDLNTIEMGTPTCVTYPEWTGQNVDDIDLSILGERPYRVLKPDSMMTMDYLPIV